MSSAQERLDQLRSTSGQRWVLVAIAIGTPVVACLAIGAATRSNPAGMCVAVGAVALWAALRPDAHVDIFVMIAVVVFWLARIDDVVTPWAIVVALALLGHHATMSLMAAAPHSAVFAADIIHRWVRRSVAVAVATVGVWIVVFLLDHRHAAGNATLSLAALLGLAVATLVVRARSLPRR